MTAAYIFIDIMLIALGLYLSRVIFEQGMARTVTRGVTIAPLLIWFVIGITLAQPGSRNQSLSHNQVTFQNL